MKINSESEELYELRYLAKKATDRGVVVYDSSAEPGLLTSKLVDLLQEVSREAKTGNIVEIYGRANALKEHDPESVSKHIMIYAIADEVWDKIEDYYINNLEGCYAAGDSNLVIALSDKNIPLLGSF